MSDFTQSSAALVGALEAAAATSLKAGAERIASVARANAPVLRKESRYRVPGALRDAIGVHQAPAKDGRVSFSVGIDQTKAPYGGFQELGFHAVGSKRVGGGLRARPGRLQDRVNAGGARYVPGLHFLQHAFDANQEAISTDVAKQVQDVIAKVNA